MGCYAQLNPSAIDADIIIGNVHKSNVVELLKEYLNTHQYINKVADLKIFLLKICT